MKAEKLLDAAEREPDAFVRQMMAAAAVTEVIAERAVLVGGSAEIYWARSDYYPTDIDFVVALQDRDVKALQQLGFKRDGRHWYRPDSNVSLEFPETLLDGDPNRVKREPVGGSTVYIIGVDDLYLDRLRQSTAERTAGQRFYSALAIASARYEEMDFRYINRRMSEEIAAHPQLSMMRDAHRQILRRIRRSIDREAKS